MEAIFHEKQEGSLCAQHCLNALLQGNYFTAVDLAELARQLDDDERSHMAEAGVQSDEYRRFLEQPSSNFDDSGFFSIQVIQKAVLLWGLELLPYNSDDVIAVESRRDPTQQSAFICNFREHWFAIRQLGHQWFNLNSLLTGPELVSNTYLSMFLTQLQQEGYSIFIVLGDLPECEADQLLKVMPAIQPTKPRLITDTKPQSEGSTDIDTDDLQRALQESRQLAESEDTALQKALVMSMEGLGDLAFAMPSPSDAGAVALPCIPQPASLVGVSPGPSSAPQQLTAAELREKRLAYLERSQPPSKEPQEEGEGEEEEEEEEDEETVINGEMETERLPPSEMTEEQMLQEAIKMSMQLST